MADHLSWLEAGVVGALQGVSELFPVSSLGHSVLLPAVVGGDWAKNLDVSASESPYLAFIVGTHVATAIALIVFYWRDWLRLISGLFTSVRKRRAETADERLIWLLIIATVPVGLVGLLFEHWLRTTFGKPWPAAGFLMVNGLILIGIEHLTRRRQGAVVLPEDDVLAGVEADRRLADQGLRRAVLIGSAQILALAPGISRSGIATAAGMGTGLKREDALRFSFLLATPVILAAGVLKLPDLFGPLGNGNRPQILFGSVLAGIGAYLSVRFLTRYVHTNSLRPFGIYCLVAGAACMVLFAVR
ncbi:MAG: undecaprenyl-diphosphate phosphatase [Actinomycetota bacterium]|nr:undecaprenyl-diphosphate phosphatase [Actinomycetota bacterium]